MDPAADRLIALLGNLTNYERRRPDRPRWSLDNMMALLQRPGFELPDGTMVQVGGSKGKGTTVMYLESLAKAAGLRTGSYTSPHVQSLLERVRILGRTAREDELCDALVPVVEFAREHLVEPTFFEVMTAAALSCFARVDADFVALEVGLGGRLDATTAVPVAASIVTSIEREHTELLGDTVEEIAGEKAFVIREGLPAFTSATGPALSVLQRRAEQVGASLAVLGRDFELVDVRDVDEGFEGRLRLPSEDLAFRLPAASAFELPALALAVACLRGIRPDLCLELNPAPRTILPGRCEILTCADGAPLVLDGAHTVDSTRALAHELRRRFPGQRLAVLFGSARGKRWRESLKCLQEMADTFVVTAPTDTPMEPPEEILAWLRRGGSRCERADSIVDGLAMLAEQGGVRVITGSFYVVGAARSHLEVFGASTQA